jgi:midasin
MSVVPVFEAARQRSQGGNSVVRQLCLVISDGRLDSEDRRRLSAVGRSLTEKHILPVLLLPDTPADARDSVFNTRVVQFSPAGAVNTVAYLDHFPMPYYTVIQKAEALPEVLSAALRQWFEAVANNSNGN